MKAAGASAGGSGESPAVASVSRPVQASPVPASQFNQQASPATPAASTGQAPPPNVLEPVKEVKNYCYLKFISLSVQLFCILYI